MSWEIVIGLETHAQLSTVSKMFSGGSTAFGAPPNTQANAVDIALPGVLPVANKGAVERAIRFGLAVGATINRRSVFARKNYFYPDLPKAYQISQYELPIVQGGEIPIVSPTRGEIKIRLTRAHLEEDAGKSLHEDFHGMSGIDLNRAGVPLLEIVSEPEMRSAAEAVAYAKTLHSLVRWIGICDGNMQEGSFRCDANVSVRRPGAPLGTRCEIKNLNSFRFMEKAIEFEVKRQIDILEDGGKIVQETRLYDADRDETRSMRTKEEAHDYRYFPDPDLLPLEVSEDWVESTRQALPELPSATRQRYKLEYGLSDYDTALLTQSREMAEYFEAVVTHELLEGFEPARVAKMAANLILGELSAIVSRNETDFGASRIRPPALVDSIRLVLDGKVSVSAAKKLLEEIWKHGDETIGELCSRISQPKFEATTLYTIQTDKNQSSGNSTVAATVHAALGDLWLWPTDNAAELEKTVDAVLAANAKQVEDYRAGKDKAFNSLVGQVMKATKGKANPAQVNEILKRKLAR
ncbi:MAG TPA: Asp-tRNA(Asn)/Glu-tRNA(Gln) amidotransferase subunit GatB [Burkholderiales bacterium]|nr:Asp-tRNA(Asn)/Glu-tRNA(Gln) amidotransferase subunit GatB [Burkholderiales bacterium]